MYPTSKAIPFILNTTAPQEEFIEKLLNRAKKLNKKEFAHNLLHTMDTVSVLNRRTSLPLEIVTHIISFADGKTDSKKLYIKRKDKVLKK